MKEADRLDEIKMDKLMEEIKYFFPEDKIADGDPRLKFNNHYHLCRSIHFQLPLDDLNKYPKMKLIDILVHEGVVGTIFKNPENQKRQKELLDTFKKCFEQKWQELNLEVSTREILKIDYDEFNDFYKSSHQ